MKILIVSNLYPPFYRGGYEIRCSQVAEELQHLGHEVRVLTSVYGLPMSRVGDIRRRTEEVNGVSVHRCLDQYAYKPQPFRRPWTLFQARRELSDARHFLKTLATFRPDVVNWWNMNGLSKTLLGIPGRLGIPDIHWVEHPWMIHEYGVEGERASVFWIRLWEGNWGPRVWRPLFGWAGTRWEKRVAREGIPTRSFPNRPRHVCFVSEYLRTVYREAGLEFVSSEVIHGGVPAEQFYQPICARGTSEPLRVLYAGQISPDRGLHTAVEAIGRMDPTLRPQLTLSVVGDSSSSYFADIKGRVRRLNLTGCVFFLAKVPHEEMSQIYKQHDILVFPSTRPEGLPLAMVEAMLAGCAVVTTGSGGATEIATMADLPVFPKHDPVALSKLLARFVADRAELTRIAARGQEVALREFSFELMMERWATTLQRIHEHKSGLHVSCGNSPS